MTTLVASLLAVIGSGAAPSADSNQPPTDSLPSTAPATQPTTTSQPLSPDEALWREITTASSPITTTQPFQNWFEAARAQREQRLERVRLFLRLYPGSERRAEAAGLELETLFELGALQGGEFDTLCKRVSELLKTPPTDPALAEAHYWNLVCERASPDEPFRRPDASVLQLDDQQRHAYREFLRRFPDSRHALRIGTLLYDDAARRDDLAALRKLVLLLEAHWPQHVTVDQLRARLNRREARGAPFWLTCPTVDGKQIDTRDWVGRKVGLIVVWATFSKPARALLPEIEAYRAQHDDVAVVGVNLDASTDQMNTALKRLAIPWPQCNDGMGWANTFVRRWGVHEIPFVFVIDRDGLLAETSTAQNWAQRTEAVRHPPSKD